MMVMPPPQSSSKSALLRSERAMLFLGVMALLSSLMLWWASHLSRITFPQHIALLDNLQQAQRSINTTLLHQTQLLAGTPVDHQKIFSPLENASLKIKDCLEGRSTLEGIRGIGPTGTIRSLLYAYAEALDRLTQTMHTLADAHDNRAALHIQQLKEFHELGQIGDAIETELAQMLAQIVARKNIEQRIRLGFWLLFLFTAFFLLYRANRIESAQAQQEQLIHALLDSTNDAIFVKDRTGRYLFCNQATQQFLGKDAADVIGHDDRQLFPPEIAQQMMTIDREVMASGTTSHHEEQLITLQGTTFWFMVAKGVLRDRQENVTGLFGISRDITRQRLDEEQLRHHRLMLQRTSRLAKVGGWECDPQTRQGTWTEECARIHDLDPTEKISVAQGLSFYRGEHRRRIEQALEEAVTHGRPYDLELEMITAKGAIKWVRTQCEPVVEKGQVTYIYGALQDITERKQAEEALRAGERALKEAQRLAEVGNWSWELESDVHAWSDEVYRIYGRDRHLPPATYPEVQQYFAPESWQMLNQAVERCFQTGQSYTCDAEVIRPDGSFRWITIRGKAICGEDDRVQRLVGTIQDITGRKQMERILRESEQRYRTLFEQSMDAIAIMDGYPPRYRFVNPAFIELFGFSEEEIRTMTGDRTWSLVHPDDLPTVQSSLRERMEGRATVARYEFRIVRKDGGIRWVEASGSVARLSNSIINQTIYRDITPRKQAEAVHRTLQEQLTQAQKMESIGRLAGGIAHDFNNMLGVILGEADMMEDQLEPGSLVHKDLQQIKKAAQRSAELTRQLLAFARKQTIAPKVLDINATIEGLLKMLRRLIGEDIDLVWAPATPLWSVRIDPSQVDQILANLCINARDAINGAGKLTIETGNAVFDASYCGGHLECAPGEYVVLAVSDNGCGMDRLTMERIFEPFFTTKDVGEGTGLGLSTVYGIVRQNNGFIHVYSEPGHGSSFKIYLPRFGETVQAEQQENPVPDTYRKGATILLVEDEKALLELNQRMLTDLGYGVLAASTPGEAICYAQEHQETIDLLLTDVVMPEMNGRQLATELRRILPALRQIFMSGYTANVIAHHGVLEPGVYFLQKPFSKKELAAKLNMALSEPPTID